MKITIRLRQTFQSPSAEQRRKAVTARMQKLIGREVKKTG